jgi:hypothetical protein
MEFFSGVKRLARETDNPPPCTAEINNEYSYTCTMPVGFNDLHEDIFTLPFARFHYWPNQRRVILADAPPVWFIKFL